MGEAANVASANATLLRLLLWTRIGVCVVATAAVYGYGFVPWLGADGDAGVMASAGACVCVAEAGGLGLLPVRRRPGLFLIRWDMLGEVAAIDIWCDTVGCCTNLKEGNYSSNLQGSTTVI